MKKKTLIQILLSIVAFVLVLHLSPLSNWYRMNGYIQHVMSNPGYTRGSFFKISNINKSVAVRFSYKIDGEEYINIVHFSVTGPFADTGFRNKLNRDFLVVYNKDNPALSVMVTSCPITEESQVNQYIGKAIEWRFYSGAHIKED